MLVVQLMPLKDYPLTDPNLYKDSAARFDTVVGKNEYFILLRKMREEYNELDTGPMPFEEYALEQYGLQVVFDVTYSVVTSDHKIVNEEKYLLARIKFA